MLATFRSQKKIYCKSGIRICTREGRVCMIWVRILVRRKLQTLSYPTHKDSNQYLSRLLQNIRLKIHDFGNFQEMSPKSEKTQNPNSSARSNQDIFVVGQKFVFNPSALEGSDLVMFDAQEFRSISCAFTYIVCK